MDGQVDGRADGQTGGQTVFKLRLWTFHNAVLPLGRFGFLRREISFVRVILRCKNMVRLIYMAQM